MFWRLCLFHSVNEILIIYLLRTKLSVPETVTSPYVSYGNGLTSEQEHRHALRSKRWQINDDYTRQAVLHLLCSWHAGWKLGKTWPHLNAIKITGKLEGIHLAHCTRAQLDRGLLILVLESSYSVIFFLFSFNSKNDIQCLHQETTFKCNLCTLQHVKATCLLLQFLRSKTAHRDRKASRCSPTIERALMPPTSSVSSRIRLRYFCKT